MSSKSLSWQNSLQKEVTPMQILRELPDSNGRLIEQYMTGYVNEANKIHKENVGIQAQRIDPLTRKCELNNAVVNDETETSRHELPIISVIDFMNNSAFSFFNVFSNKFENDPYAAEINKFLVKYTVM